MPESCCYEIRIILTPKGLSWTGTTKPGQGSHPKEDQEDIHPSLDGTIEDLQPVETGCKISESSTAFRNGQEQAVTPPVLGLALAAAEAWELNLTQQEVFVNFMAARFPEETDWEYIDTWANRFYRRVEVSYCDNLSAAKMLEIVKTLKGETKLFPTGCI